jgi:fibro-slime domain-containing protein
MNRVLAGALALTLSAAVVVSGCDDTGDGSRFPSGSGGAGANGTGAGNPGSGGSGAFNPTGSGGNGASSSGGNSNCGNQLVGVVRDFSSSHPDFERPQPFFAETGIVKTDLGADLKPVFNGPTGTTTSQADFDQWYRDTPGVNQPMPLSITLTESAPGVFTFDDGDFFPIDGQLLGDEGNAHNYHFTYEIHAEFTYEGGEVFTFTGDDDLFTFINGKLAIDLGGVHGPMSATIDLDQQASALGIDVGGTYSLDFFFAERHTTQSNFRIDTSIVCFDEVQPPT